MQRRAITPDSKLLICGLADWPMTARGSSFDFGCAKCGTRLMVAPSGQIALKTDALLTPICPNCIPDDDLDFRGFIGPDEDVLREAQTAIPNLRPQRN